jgi:ribokinase
MNPDPAVCVVGSFMMDLTIRTRRRPEPGETVIGTSFDQYLGGKGFNQALAAARSDAVTAMVGRLGDDDYGRLFLRRLREEGIDLRHVAQDPLEGTGIGAPVVDESGENAIVVVPRANHAVSVEDIHAASGLIGSARVLLLQLELPVAVVLAAAACARHAGTAVVLNPAPAVSEVEPFADLVDVIVPNQAEAAQLTGLSFASSSPAQIATALSQRTGAQVVLTLGADGVLVLERGTREPVLVPAHQVEVVDTVAAGDAFCGALGAELARGSTLLEAAAYANAAAGLAVTRRGAEPSIPRRTAVSELLAGDLDSLSRVS